LLDPRGETSDLFEVRKISTASLVEKKGKMVGKAMGPRDWKYPEAASIMSLLVE
jgi:hypothetical protein